MTDPHARAARDLAVRQALADRVAADTSRGPVHHPHRRPRLVMLTAVIVLGLGIGLPVSLNAFRGADSSTVGSSNTLFSPPEPNHRVPNIGNLVDRPTVDFAFLDSPDELAALEGYVVVYGTIAESRGSGDKAVLTVATLDSSQGHGHFQTGDDVKLILTAFNDDTRADVARINDELPPGTAVVAFGAPSNDGSIDLAGPQSLAVQLAGSDQVFWPGMGNATGEISQALPGGHLVGPPIDTSEIVDTRWVLTEAATSSDGQAAPVDLGDSRSAWWEVSTAGSLRYDAGCGTGTVDVVPIIHGYRVLNVVTPAPSCDNTPVTTTISQAFAAIFESDAFVVNAPLGGQPPVLYSPTTGYQLTFTTSTSTSTVPPSEAPSSLPSADPTQPPTDTTPAAVGLWQLSDPAAVHADSTTVQLVVTRLECSGGETGAVLPPEVSYETDRIVIKTPLAPNPPGAYTCPSNDSVPLTVQLREPIGARQLIDAACVEGQAASTSYCTDGPVRWRP